MAEYAINTSRASDLSQYGSTVRQRGKISPEAVSLLKCARQLLEEQEYEKSERVLREALRECPDYPDALADLAICLAEGSGKFTTAEKLASKAIKLAPRMASGYFALGYVNLLGSRLDKGYRLILKARELAPEDPRVQLGIDTYQRQRKPVISDLSRNNYLNVVFSRFRMFMSSVRNRMIIMSLVFVAMCWLGLHLII